MSRNRCTVFFGVAMVTSICGAAAVAADVTYFNQVPTPKQVAEALSGKPVSHVPAAKSSKVPGRGIQWSDEASGAATTGAAAEVASYSSAEGAAPAVAVPVNFDSGSSQVLAGSLPYVEAIAGALQADPQLRLVVEGHTDSNGSANRNLILSWERAFTVFRVLVNKYHIDPNRLRPEGKGMSEPLQGMSPFDGRNRRVQFRPLIAGQ